MATITQKDSRWCIDGDVLMDDANDLLMQSKQFDLLQEQVIDFAKVQEVDTATVSLMLEWRRRAIAEKKHIIFDHLPHGLVSLTALYGVKEILS